MRKKVIQYTAGKTQGYKPIGFCPKGRIPSSEKN
jgi:hypothetical protein